MGSKFRIYINLNTQKMFSSLSRESKRMLAFLIKFLSLFGIGALVYFLLDHNNHVGVMIVSTVAPVIGFAMTTYVYLRINWVAPDVIGEDAVPSKMAQCKRKLLAYVAIGFLLGVPSVYFIIIPSLLMYLLLNPMFLVFSLLIYIFCLYIRLFLWPFFSYQLF